jgi:Flp pilus assembly protein TadD
MTIRRQHWLVALLLVAVTLAAFWRVLGAEFVLYDDDRYVTDNSRIKTGFTTENLKWAFTTGYQATWQPLTWLSYMPEWRIYGANPFGYHLTNLLLHLANVLLLFLVLNRMTGSLWRSGFVAALFGIHPLRVESVAWVAERKDVLSGLFWMLTMWAYVRYTERTTLRRYMLVAVFLALGLMAKPMLVTLPFALLLLDYWPLNRLTFGKPGARSQLVRLILEKVPLLALSAASSAMTYHVQQVWGAAPTLKQLSLGIRLATSVWAYAKYLWMTVWPRGLAFFYPHPANTLPEWQVAGAWVLLALTTVLVIRAGRPRPYIAVGWLWYLGTLVPVIGLIQTGSHALADRFTYIPLIGIFIIAAWGVPDVASRLSPKLHARVIAIFGSAAVAAFAACTWVQTGYWQNSVVLFERALRVTSRNYLAHTNLAIALAEKDDLTEAAKHSRAAVRINPTYAHAHLSLGMVLTRQGKLDEAVSALREAIRLKPDLAPAYNALGNALSQQGKLDEAVEAYTEAVQKAPDYAQAHYNLGVALSELGKIEAAVAEYRAAVRFNPEYAQAYHNLGSALDDLSKIDEAMAAYREAIRIKPDLAEAHNNLAVDLYYAGRYAEAWKEVRLSRKYGAEPAPDFLDALSNKMAEGVRSNE